MSTQIMLTPEELFVLGSLMKAKYIDYGYIASMRDIQQNYAAVKAQCIQSLARAGVLRQRLSGETAIRPAAAGLLNNIFFGRKETALDTVFPNGGQPALGTRFHFGDASVTMVESSGRQLTLSEMAAGDMERVLRAAIGHHAAPGPLLPRIDMKSVTRALTARSAEVGFGAAAQTVYEQDGALYTLDGDSRPEPLADADAFASLYRIIKGE